MRVKVKFLLTFREIFHEKEGEIELKNASNIQDLLNLLCDASQRRQRIFDPSGELRPNINILKNGRNIHFLGGLQAELEDGDSIAIFPAIAGG